MGAQADVLGDLEEPRFLGDGNDASLKRAERLEKGRLHRILGLRVGAQTPTAEAEDSIGVAFVEPLERTLGVVRGSERDDRLLNCLECGHRRSPTCGRLLTYIWQRRGLLAIPRTSRTRALPPRATGPRASIPRSREWAKGLAMLRV